MSEPSLPQPDLQIFVRRVSPDDPKRITFEVSAADPALRLNLRVYGPVQLDLTPEEYVASLFGDFKFLLLKTEEDRQNAAQKIAGKGASLFAKLLPEGLQQLLWSQRATEDRVSTLQVVSDDPHIPWELMRLRGQEGEDWITGPFLCEAFALTHWIRQIPQNGRLPVRRLALVVPRTSGLPAAESEKADLSALSGPDREVTEIPATYLQVLDHLATGAYDAWHFGSHGGEIEERDRNADLWSLELDDHPMTPEDLEEKAANLGRSHPFVFFNSCHVGRSGRSLVGIGGWPAAFLRTGAGAFLGALWQVRDSKARTFAKAFYELFLGGLPIGEAVRQARLRIKDADPTWLAYAIFAHPLATCTGTLPVAAGGPLVIPRRTWEPSLSPPGALLQAEYGIVPFHGREKEMDDLRAWCRDDGPLRLRLYTGPGGMGKTRLALEMAGELRKEGWRAGFLRRSDLASPEAAWKRVARPGGKVLVVVDYAETQRDLLIPLLRGMREAKDGPYRVILLARAALDWWEQLKTDRDVGDLFSGPATSRYSLAPLAFDLPKRAESYGKAAGAFSERLDRPCPERLPENLQADYFERVLLLHMEALIAVEGGEGKAQGEDGILDQILYRERRHWRERVKSMHLPQAFDQGIGRAMAAITLGGGVAGEDQAVEVLRGLTFFREHPGDVLTRTARLLHEIYPGTRWIDPVLPDLLGEHLVQRELEAGADELLDLVLGPPAAG